jgi:hypothetical protein
MPWSGGLTTIRVPADATDGGGVPYIDIGADVPAEIATDMTAGLIWQSGQPVTGMYGFRYWAFGIMKSGRLEFVLYWFQDVSAGAGLYQYYRRTALSLAPPIGADQPAVLSLGGGDYSTYGEGLFRVVGAVDPGCASRFHIPHRMVTIPREHKNYGHTPHCDRTLSGQRRRQKRYRCSAG